MSKTAQFSSGRSHSKRTADKPFCEEEEAEFLKGQSVNEASNFPQEFCQPSALCKYFIIAHRGTGSSHLEVPLPFPAHSNPCEDWNCLSDALITPPQTPQTPKWDDKRDSPSSLVGKVNESELQPGQGRLWEEGQFALLGSGL